jgi:DNA-binding NtrC family response regulator
MQGTSTILVVGDALSVKFITLALHDEGYRVRAARDLIQAHAEIAVRRPDLVLLDSDMSGMIGALLVQDLHEVGLIDVPVVIMTDEIGTAQGLPQRGIADCLIKPFDVDDLLNCVAQYIPRQRERGAAY